MCAESITLFDGRWQSRANNGSTDGRIGRPPLKRKGSDAMLIWVCCHEMLSVDCIQMSDQSQGLYGSYANNMNMIRRRGKWRASGYQTLSG